jgi:hypothetical protein
MSGESIKSGESLVIFNLSKIKTLNMDSSKLVLPLLFLSLVSLSMGYAPLDVLVVNDGHVMAGDAEMADDEYLSRYVNPLESMPDINVTVENVSSMASGPTAEEMAKHDIVIWYTLNDHSQHPDIDNSLTDQDMGNLKSYLEDHRGRLLLTGQQVHKDIQQEEFTNDTLKTAISGDGVSASYHLCRWDDGLECDDEDTPGGVTYSDDRGPVLGGISGDPIMDESMERIQFDENIQPDGQRGIIMDICNYRNDSLDERADCDTTQDTLRNLHTSQSQWYMEEDGEIDTSIECFGFYCYIVDPPDDYATSATRTNAPDYKTAFFSFGFEAVESQDSRQQLMENTVNYLAGPRSYGAWLYADGNIAGTEVNERRYVNTTMDFGGYCRNLQRNSGNTINNMEWTYSENLQDPRVRHTDSENNTIAWRYYDSLNAYYGSDTLNSTEEIDPGSPDGVNLTAGIHCQDNSAQGYWGQFDREWFVVDHEAPQDPLELNFTRDYYPDGNAELNVSFVTRGDGTTIRTDPGYRYDLVRFRCQGGNWGSWREYNDSRLYEIYQLNVSDSSLGCGYTGENTIEIQGRDYAGNFGNVVSESVVVDREAPVVNADPGELGNSIFITGNQSITLDITDNWEVSQGEDASENEYYNGSDRFTFSPGDSIDPGFSEGTNYLDVFAYDQAGNENTTTFEYIVDTEPPTVDYLSPSNDSFIRPEEEINVEVSEDRSFKSLTLWNGSENTSFNSEAVSYDNGWSDSRQEWLSVWAEDTAGHVTFYNYSWFVDPSDPQVDSVTPSPDSYISNRTGIVVEFSDADSPVDFSRADNGTYNRSIVSGESFQPGWKTGGPHSIQIYLNDSADNTFSQEYSFTVDEKPPEAFTNYTDNSWRNSSQLVEVNASDNYQQAFISWEEHRSGLSPTSLDQVSPEGENVTVSVDCGQGKVCRRQISFMANDSAGLTSSDVPEKTPAIRIDNSPAETDIVSPSEGSTVSGEISFEFWTGDQGVGLQSTEYYIYNSSDPSQVFKTGQISSGTSEVSWDSTQDISTSETVTVNLSAEDQFLQSTSESHDFTVENDLLTTSVREPSSPYVAENFDTVLESSIPSGVELEYHNYTLENSTETVLQENKSVSGQYHNFTDLDVSGLADGNYTLTSYASATDSTTDTDSFEFRLDTQPPQVSIDNPSNTTWQTGEISMGYTALDETSNDTFTWGYEQAGTGDTFDLDPGVSAFDFPTGNCEDSANPDCVVTIYGEDRSGNNATYSVHLKIDNSPPETSFTSPEDGTWHREDFTVEREDTDNVATDLQCFWYNQTSTEFSTGCGSSFSVDISEVCSEQGERSCRINLKSENNAGLTTEVSRRFSIDYTKPKITGKSHADGELLNASENLTYRFEDVYSGVEIAEVDTGDGWTSITSGESFDPGWNSSGEKTAHVRITDIAGNTLEKTYTYKLDAEPPEIQNYNISTQDQNTSRLYPGEEAVFTLKASDFSTVTTRTVSLETPDGEENVTFRSGSQTASFSSTEQLGDYGLKAVYLEDEANNRRKVTDLPGFQVITASGNVSFGGETDLDAFRNDTLVMEVDFNRSAGGKAVVETPIFSDTGVEKFENTSIPECLNCSASTTEDGFVISSSNETSELRFNARSPTPETDSVQNFSFGFADYTSTDSLEIEPPNLTISQVSCVDCELGQFESLEFSVNWENSGNGSSLNHSLTVESSDLNYVNSTNYSGLSPWEMISLDFEENFTSVGNHTLNFTLEDSSGYYTDNESLDLEILDTEKPEIDDVSIVDEVIMVNRSANITASITDNSEVENGTVELLRDGNRQNLSMAEASEEWYANYSSTSDTGFYNFTSIYAFDSAGNLASRNLSESFKVVNTTLDTYINNLSVERAKFQAEVKDNASEVDGISVEVEKPRGANESFRMRRSQDNFTANYTNVSRSGNYLFNLTVNAGEELYFTRDGFVEYGDAKTVSEDSRSGELRLVIDSSPYNLEWTASAVDGDARDVSVDFSSSDSSVIQASNSSTEDLGNVTYEKGTTFNKFFEASQIGETVLEVKTTDSDGDTVIEQYDVVVSDEDNQDPEINSVNLSEEKPNQREVFNITANVTDNSLIRDVEAVIETNSSEKTVQVPRETGSIYSTDINISEVGTANLTVIATDLSENDANRTVQANVSDSINAEVFTEGDIFVRGERIYMDINATDANGEKITDYSANITVDMNGSERKVMENGGGRTFMIASDEDAPNANMDPKMLPVDYTAEMELYWNNNTENDTHTFQVTRLLETEWISPSGNIQPGETFEVTTDWKRPDGSEIRPDSTVYTICDECPSEYQMMSSTDAGTYSQEFQAPNETGEITIRGYARNRWNAESQEVNNK